MPNLFLLAGPNGAGKSTSAPELLSGVRRVTEFVNADVIQNERAISEFEAGRITLTRLTALAMAGKDVAFEIGGSRGSVERTAAAREAVPSASLPE